MSFQKNKLFRFFIVFILVISNTFFLTHSSNNEQILNLDYNRYYYNQLDNLEKAIYDNLIKSQEKFLNKEEVFFEIATYEGKNSVKLQEYVPKVMKARNAYQYDNPKVNIWFDNYKCALYSKEGIIYLKCTLKEEVNEDIFFASDNINKSIAEFELKCLNIANSLYGSEKEKLRQIHDYITKNAIYDKTLLAPDTKNAYGNIMAGCSVCSGFALAYKHIADLAELKVLYVVGNIYNEENNEYILHAWNVAYVDGEYWLIDPTFDLQMNGENNLRFFLSPVQDGMHYARTDYFNYIF